MCSLYIFLEECVTKHTTNYESILDEYVWVLMLQPKSVRRLMRSKEHSTLGEEMDNITKYIKRIRLIEKNM